MSPENRNDSITQSDHDLLEKDYYSGERVAETVEIVKKSFETVKEGVEAYKISEPRDGSALIEGFRVHNESDYDALVRARRWVKVISHATPADDMKKFFTNLTTTSIQDVLVLSVELNHILSVLFENEFKEDSNNTGALRNAIHCASYGAIEVRKLEQIAGDQNLNEDIVKLKYYFNQRAQSLATVLGDSNDFLRVKVDEMNIILAEIRGIAQDVNEMPIDTALSFLPQQKALQLLIKLQSSLEHNPQAKIIKSVYSEGIKETIDVMAMLLDVQFNHINSDTTFDNINGFISSAFDLLDVAYAYLSYPLGLDQQSFKEGAVDTQSYQNIWKLVFGASMSDFSNQSDSVFGKLYALWLGSGNQKEIGFQVKGKIQSLIDSLDQQSAARLIAQLEDVKDRFNSEL